MKHRLYHDPDDHPEGLIVVLVIVLLILCAWGLAYTIHEIVNLLSEPP